MEEERFRRIYSRFNQLMGQLERSLAYREPFAPYLASIVDIGGLRLRAIADIRDQVEQLGVGTVPPAPAARLTDDRRRRLAHVRRGECARLGTENSPRRGVAPPRPPSKPHSTQAAEVKRPPDRAAFLKSA
jgi:hypothetical protein